MSDRLIKLLLIDDDPIFRLGFCTALQAYSDLQVIAQVDTVAAALTRLTEQVPEIVILDPSLQTSPSDTLSGWQFCEYLKQQYPDLPLLLLSANIQSQQLLAAQASGVEGYVPKGTPIDDLVSIIRQIARGETHWPSLADSLQISTKQQPTKRKKQWFVRMRESGLQQIEESLAVVNRQLNYPQLPLLDWLFWSGRKRELLTVHWLVNQLFPVEVIVIPQPSQQQEEQTQHSRDALLPIPLYAELPVTRINPPSAGSIVFEHTLAKIQIGVENGTDVLLEIDILQPDKKRELLYIILYQIRKVLDELRFLRITSKNLPERQSLILRDIWQSSALEFFGTYYTPTFGFKSNKIADILLQDGMIIQEEILDKIPFIFELFAYLLFEQNLLINQIDSPPESPEAINRAEILLQNLMIQIANGVMVIILNNFSENEEIKQTLYNINYISAREIARFRNNLAWRYRQEKYIDEPKNIFESKYRLLALNGSRIKKILIYASRQEELNQLRGIPWTITIALEARDAIAPRLKAIVAFIGNGLVYLLTKVIGRGIGLIGRGIIQGIGNTLQETRYGNQGGGRRTEGTGGGSMGKTNNK